MRNLLLPVVVFIHGGGYFFGSGNDDFHGPERAMNEDIVLVTINYRVGVFGFLASEEHGLKGKRQVDEAPVAQYSIPIYQKKDQWKALKDVLLAKLLQSYILN